jgi:hypothetical protein
MVHKDSGLKARTGKMKAMKFVKKNPGHPLKPEPIVCVDKPRPNDYYL